MKTLGINPKAGAFFMAFLNTAGGAVEVIGGIVELCYSVDEGNKTLFILCILLGTLSFCCGLLLLFGIIQGKEKYVLIYVLVGFINIFIVTIYSGINMFEYKWLMTLFFLSGVFLFGHYLVYVFYEEIKNYNTVTSGAIQVTYNEKSYVNEASEAEDAL